MFVSVMLENGLNAKIFRLNDVCVKKVAIACTKNNDFAKLLNSELRYSAVAEVEIKGEKIYLVHVYAKGTRSPEQCLADSLRKNFCGAVDNALYFVYKSSAYFCNTPMSKTLRQAVKKGLSPSLAVVVNSEKEDPEIVNATMLCRYILVIERDARRSRKALDRRGGNE
jgi:hypothetical protein